mmetsp:Transcript_24921/g.29436  ORF Transcript_24921/g.29436 Transcript_24921/m.29436 type:complete len:676 (+) Transcript_24921:60-2087(+)
MMYAKVSNIENNENVDIEDIEYVDTSAPSKRVKILGSISVLLVAALGFSARGKLPMVQNFTYFSSVSTTETLLTTNELETRTGRVLNDGLFENLVRVHSTTTLKLESGNSAMFYIETAPHTGELVQVTDQPVISLDYVFTEVGQHLVQAEVVALDGSISSFQYTVSSKVIRIELRDLTEEDRIIYFEALRAFQFTSQVDGVAAYGKKYKSLEYLLRQHLYGAADKACDHWHDDAGMINHHVGITWLFEQSLRKIDPRTASHYWDYTRESGRNIDWYDSDIFNDDWFGDNSPNNPLHVVDKGRFAYSPVFKGIDFSDIVNPYGLLRSPWNTNPTPYVLRYNKTFYNLADSENNFPSCNNFAKYMKSTLAETVFGLNGALHGPVHIMIGGHWGSAKKWETVGSTISLSDKFLLLSKWLWRQGFVRTPDSCSEDTPHSECMPTCPEGIVGDWDSMTPDDAYSILVNTGVLDLQPEVGLHKSMVNNGLDWRDLLQELCHVGSPGDAYSSAAPQDPTFWPLHGNAERLISVMRIYKNRGIIDFDETWGYAHIHSLPSDTGMICDWSEATGTLDMPTCTKGVCSGHKEDDLLPFTDLYEKQGSTLYTNAEFYALLDPLSHELPYAFDTLFYWEACEKNNILEEYKYLSDKNSKYDPTRHDDDDDNDDSSSSLFKWFFSGGM